ncbi:helix-turn-helix domain-containing protein [Gluconobacter cerinus]|uniref:helix-turn-helix domain-containing protein n=1 Tax=Gluconobacter cerinus TaxID=38307 RepID=UPI003AB50CC3
MIENTLANRLKKAREEVGFSQSKLARIVGVTPQAIQALEAGTSAGSKHLAAISGALGVEAVWLATGEGDLKRKPRRDISDPSEAQPVGNLHFLMGFDKEDPLDDGWSFPPTRIVFNADTIPIFVCQIVDDSRIPKKAKEEITKKITDWIYKSNVDDPDFVERITDTTRDKFFSISGDVPDDYIPRPHYLKGQGEAYAIYIIGNKTISPVNINKSIAFISPHKNPQHGDIVVIWHKTNTFIVSKFLYDSGDYIGLENQYLVNDSLNEEDPDKYFSMTDTTVLSKDQIRSVHCVGGVEFSAPRSPKIQQ